VKFTWPSSSDTASSRLGTVEKEISAMNVNLSLDAEVERNLTARAHSIGLGALDEERNQICLCDLLRAYRGPGIKDFFSGSHLRQRPGGTQILREIIIRELSRFLKLAEGSTDKSKAVHDGFIFPRKRKLPRVHNSVGGCLHDAVLIRSPESCAQGNIFPV